MSNGTMALRRPEMRRQHNDFAYIWPAEGLAIDIERVYETATAVRGEMIVRTTDPLAPHVIGPIVVNLVDGDERGRRARQLQERSNQPLQWTSILEYVYTATVREARRGEPAVDVGAFAPRGRAPLLFSGGVPEGETSIIFGDGGTLKSTVAIATAVTVITGRQVLPRWRLEGRMGAVLYLDYETSEDAVAATAQALARGVGEDLPPGALLYLPMVRPFIQDLARVREAVAGYGVNYVILDSLAPAAGDEPETARSATSLMNALRSLGPDVTRLCIGHVSKNSAQARGRARTFGSVHLENLARSVFEARKREDGPAAKDDDDGGAGVEDAASASALSGEATVGLYHRKVNRGPLQAPLAFTVQFDRDGVPWRMRHAEVHTGDGLSEALSLAQRVLLALRDARRPLPIFKIADELGEPADSVRVTLNRLAAPDQRGNGAKVVRLESEWEEEGKKSKVVWGLRHEGGAA